MVRTSRSRIGATPYGQRLLTFIVVATLALAGCTSRSAGGTEPNRSSSAGSADVDAIRASVDAFFANDFADAFRNRRAVIVSVGGEVVVEEYHDSDPATSIDIQSIGKSIMATLVGQALADGYLTSLEQTLAELLPEYVTVMSPTTRTITLRQLLTMTAGLPSDDVVFAQTGEPSDWVQYTLKTGPTTAPGVEFAYSGAGSHLLSAILSRATGMTTLEYARERLFDPLGISTTPETRVTETTQDQPTHDTDGGFTWPTDPQGTYVGAGGQTLTAADLLKLGTLWLNEGRWGDDQVVPATWVREATQNHVQTASDIAPAYGYQFWITEVDGHPAFAAVGYGGQLIEVVPELELVVVVQSTSPSDPRKTVDAGTVQANSYMTMVNYIIAPAIHSA